MVWTWNNATLITALDLSAANSTNKASRSRAAAADFLRYSLRSAQKYLRDGFGSVALLTPDVPSQQSNQEKCSHAYQDHQKLTHTGQRPCWLITTDAVYEPPQLIHHRQVACNSTASERDCMQKLSTAADPSFASLLAAQTSQLSDVRLLVSPHHVFADDVSASDFWSPLYGPTFRLHEFADSSESNYNATDAADVATARATKLLNKRFGSRPRRKLLDLPQPLSNTMLAELQATWPKELALSSSQDPNNTIDLPFMLAHYTSERYREALLWSFIIAKHDRDADGHFSPIEARALLHDLGANPDNHFVLPLVQVPIRDSRSKAVLADNLKRARFPVRLGHEAVQTSMDGSALFAPRSLSESASNVVTADEDGANPLQIHAQNKRPVVPACTLARECLSPLIEAAESSNVQQASLRATEVFTRVAHQAPVCGDCMIMHLVGSSGSRGLSALLPSPQADMPPIKALPLTPTFNGADFSLMKVATSISQPVKRVDAVAGLLSRYAYNVVVQESLVEPTLSSRLDAKIGLTTLEFFNTSSIFSFKRHDKPTASTQSQIDLAISTKTISEAAQARAQTEASWIWALYVRAWLSLRYPFPMRFELRTNEL